MDTTTNVLNWFEIPVLDMDRAVKFYSSIFDIKLESMTMGPLLMAMFPYETGSGKLAGALVYNTEWYKPSMDGSLVYFNGNPAMDGILAKVEAAGGKILQPKTQIGPDIGYMAILIDTEGNRIAIHSQN